MSQNISHTARASSSALSSRKAPKLRLVTEQVSPRREPVEPILKWAGGKSRLLPELTSRIPEDIRIALETPTASGIRARSKQARYFEPFSGGAALFFRLRPERARLTDTNAELIHLYQVVRDDVEALIEDLGRHRHERTYFYAVRAQQPEELGRIERASRMMFLNRTCFNGLWRVNRRGQFNVPFGAYTNPNLCPADRLRAVSEALQGVELLHTDFEKAVEGAKANDFVYFDPPYVPLTKTANFTAYTGQGFGIEEQERLAQLFNTLTRRKVRCMLSNSDTPLVRELFAGHRIDGVLAPRTISRKGSAREPVGEVIVCNF